MTLKDIAKEAGTTPATVSRVLNGCTRNFSVTPELRARIVAAAERGDYRPNLLFRGIRTQKNLPVSVLFPGNTIEPMRNVSNLAVQALAEELHGRGRESIISFAYSAGHTGFRLPPWKTSALILPDVRSDEQLQFVRDSDVPLFVINGMVNADCDVVACDERRNMGLLFDVLHAAGHRRIFYANGAIDMPEHYSIPERAAAYREQCALRGLPVLDGWDVRTEDVPVLVGLALRHRATAVICYNHGTAIHFLHAAWRRGLRVPADFSLVCFNDEPLLKFLMPPVTCLDPDGQALGIAAADMLGRRLEDTSREIPAQRVRIGGRIIERESVGAPSKGR